MLQMHKSYCLAMGKYRFDFHEAICYQRNISLRFPSNYEADVEEMFPLYYMLHALQ